MKLNRCAVLGLSLLLPMTALADFQYQETTQITGGSMLGLMKMAGAFSRQAKEAGKPTVSSVYIRGNKMARVNEQKVEIVDLDKETITDIDLEKRTYTQMTFEQMRQQLEKAMQQAKEKQAQQKDPAPTQAPNNVDMKFTVNVRHTGVAKEVSGLSTSESIMTMQMEGTDKTNGQKGAFAITNDMWLTPTVPGYDEMREFNKKFAIKMGDIFTGSGLASSLGAMQPGMSQGVASMAKEVSKLQGIPILQVMRMGVTANGDPLPAASEAPLPANATTAETPSAGDIANQSVNAAIASQLSAFHLGGFGHKNTHVPAADAATDSATSGVQGKMSGFGFGHKKKQAAPQPDNSADSQQQTAAQAQTAGVLMESKTEMTGFSSASIDSSKFSVPAGFKEVQPATGK